MFAKKGQTKDSDQQLTRLQQLRQSCIAGWIKAHGLRKAQYMGGFRTVSGVERYRDEYLEDLQKLLIEFHRLNKRIMIIFTVMDLQAEKYTLIEELMKVTDVKLVQEIKSILQGNNPVVGYKSDGTPITKTQLQSDIAAAKRQIAAGEYTTQEDLEKESENW